MLDVITNALRHGFKTSEFAISVLAIVLPFLVNLGSGPVQSFAAAHGWIGGLVAVVYIAARAYVKGVSVKGATGKLTADEVFSIVTEFADRLNATIAGQAPASAPSDPAPFDLGSPHIAAAVAGAAAGAAAAASVTPITSVRGSVIPAGATVPVTSPASTSPASTPPAPVAP